MPVQPLQALLTSQLVIFRSNNIGNAAPYTVYVCPNTNNQACFPGSPSDDPDEGDPYRRKRYKKIDAKRKSAYIIDSAAMRDAIGRFCGSIKSEVE